MILKCGKITVLYKHKQYTIYIWSMVSDQTNQGFTNISSFRGSTIMFDLSNSLSSNLWIENRFFSISTLKWFKEAK